MLKLTLYENDKLVLNNHNGEKIEISFIKSNYRRTKIGVDAPNNYGIVREKKDKGVR